VVCDLPVTHIVDYIANDQQRLAKSGFPLLKTASRDTDTLTNPGIGKSFGFPLPVRSRIKPWSTTETAPSRCGPPPPASQGRSGCLNGRSLAMDAVRVVFVTVLNYNGTATDTGEDVMISESAESISGAAPRPVKRPESSAWSWFARSPSRSRSDGVSTPDRDPLLANLRLLTCKEPDINGRHAVRPASLSDRTWNA
jgi:hypothetical protein